MRPSPILLTHPLLLLANLLTPPASAQAPTPHPVQIQARTSTPLFPPTCLRIPADPVNLTPPNLQSALDTCPSGSAVELAPSDPTPDSRQSTTFLLPPLTLPPGVTLLIDPGVTAYTSPTAPGPLITAAPASALMGFGILDFGGRDLKSPNALLAPQGSFTLYKLTLRNLPQLATPTAPLILRDAKLPQTSPPPPNTTVLNSTFTPRLSAELFLTTPTTAPSVDLTGPGPYTLTAVLISPDPTLPPPPPDALVFFYDGPTQLGSSPITDTLAQLTLTTLAPGPHHITALYSSDSLPFGSVNITVPSVTLSSTATTAFSRTPITFTATLSDPNATGTITFLDGSTTLNQTPLTNGTASFTTSTLALGQHSISASYSGDTSNTAATSPTLAVQINSNPTITALAPITSGQPFGTPLTLTANLLPADATGSILFQDTTTNTPLGQAPLANGTATLSNIASLSVGAHAITATYPGDTDDLSSTSAPQITTIDTISTSTNLLVNPLSSTYGTPITLTASTTSGSTGNIAFSTTNSGAITTIPLNNGTATYTVSPPFAPGTYTFSATYNGDPTHAPSTSPSVSTQINPLPTTLTFTGLPSTMQSSAQPILTLNLAPTTAAGQITVNDANSGTLGTVPSTNGVANFKLPSLLPGPHTLTATYPGDTDDAPSTSPALTTQVTANSSSISLSAPSTITFGDTPTLLATVTPTSASGPITFTDTLTGTLGSALLTNGTATIKIPILHPAPHTLTATFPGDPYNTASTSQTVVLTVQPAPTATVLTLAQSTIPARNPIIFNIQVSSVAAALPSGQITLRAQSPAGLVTLATAALSNASAGKSFATITLDSASLGPGTFTSVTASYPGDTDAAPSISAPLSFTIVPTPVTATLTLSALQIPVATSVTLTARIASPAATPTGTVTFLNGTAVIATLPLNNGQATATLPPQSIGNYLITAAYTPTNLFAPITTDPILLTVIPPFTLALNPSILDLTPSSSGDATLTITPLFGFSGPLAASCTTPFPYIACKITIPAAIVNNTPAVGNVHITIARDITLTASAFRTPSPFLLAFALPLLYPLRRRLRTSARALLLLALTATLTACAPGTFFEIPSGPNIIPITVTTSTSPATTFLKVNIINKRLQ